MKHNELDLKNKIDHLGERADIIANSKWYKLAPAIAALVMTGVVAVGIGKGLAEQDNDTFPDKPDTKITVVTEK